MPLSRDVETDPHPAALLFTDVQNDNAGPDGGGGWRRRTWWRRPSAGPSWQADCILIAS